MIRGGAVVPRHDDEPVVVVRSPRGRRLQSRPSSCRRCAACWNARRPCSWSSRWTRDRPPCSSSAAAPAAMSRRSAPAQLGIATTLVEGDNARRHLPQHRLHSVQGPDPRRRAVREGLPLRAGLAARHPRRVAAHRPGADGALEGRHRRRLTGGVAALLKKNGVQVVSGWARIIDGKTVEVTTGAGQDALRIVCEHLLLAPGSQAVALPAMPFGGRVISSTEALAPHSAAEAPGRRRCRLHRAGTRHRLSQAGRRSDGGRGAGPRAAGLRRRARQAGGRVAATARRAAASGLHRAGLERERRRGAHPRRAGRRVRAAGRPGAGRGRAAAAHRGLGAGDADARHERPRRAASTTSAARRCATSGRSAT